MASQAGRCGADLPLTCSVQHRLDPRGQREIALCRRTLVCGLSFFADTDGEIQPLAILDARPAPRSFRMIHAQIMYQPIILDNASESDLNVDTSNMGHTMKTDKHRAKRTDAGKYEYRGFIVFDRGGGRSVHERVFRNSYTRWRVVRKTGPGAFDREPTRFDAPTFKDAKQNIDRALSTIASHVQESKRA
jgi:hypothetical protein